MSKTHKIPKHQTVASLIKDLQEFPPESLILFMTNATDSYPILLSVYDGLPEEGTPTVVFDIGAE